MSIYLFNKKDNPHYFCQICGSAPLEDGTDVLSQFGVNVRCVKGVDLSVLKYRDADGLSK